MNLVFKHWAILSLAVIAAACSKNITLGSMHRITVLPDNVHETSGLAYHNGTIFTLNDSGNPASVYGFELGKYSTDNDITVLSAHNYDWEEIATFDSSLVIADIGNNFNSRDTFSLYLLSLHELSLSNKQQSIASKKITFTIPEKPKATTGYIRSEFDMEAAVQLGDKFYVFTKNWLNEQSVTYEVSCKQSGQARRCDTLPFKGLVTSACALPDSLVAFVGYHNYTPFIAVCKWQDTRFSLLSSRHFWAHWACQTEGICYVPGYGLLVSAEATSLRRQSLYRVKLKNLKDIDK